MKNEPSRLPIPATFAALVAFAALYLTGGFVLMPLLALALLATYAIDTRLDAKARAPRLVRLLFFGLVLASAWIRFNSPLTDTPEMLLAYIVGQLSAVELVLQAWLRHPTGGRKGEASVLLSALVMMAASNTFEPVFIRFLAPAYIGAIVLALRAYRTQTGTSQMSRRSLLWSWLALLWVLASGAGLQFGVWTYRSEINRLGMKLLGEHSGAEAVGLSTSPQLGAAFGQSGSLSRVLRVRNPVGQPYLRAMAFDAYFYGRWSPLLPSRHFRPVARHELKPQARGQRAIIERLIDDDGLLFTPLNCAGVALPPGEHEWAPGEGGPLRSQDPASVPYVYQVIFNDDETHQGPLCPPLTPAQRARCLAIPPETDPLVRRLAARIGAGLSDAPARANAVQNYLLTHHAYSLTIEPGPGDPVSNFLRDGKAAHCEYFGAAAVILLRCLDVPARYVIGYYAHEADGPGHSVVRLRDAHAWAEVWIDGQGWIILDATPGSGRPDGRAEPLPFWLKVRESTQDIMMVARRTLAYLSRVQFGLIITSVLIVGLLLWRRLSKRNRAAPQEFSYSRPAAELRELGARFEVLLRRRDLPCPPDRTWHEHMAALDNDFNQAAQRFLHLYNAARFGAPNAAPTLADLRALLQELEQSPRPTPTATAKEPL